MEIQEIEVSEALLPEVQANENLEIIGELAPCLWMIKVIYFNEQV